MCRLPVSEKHYDGATYFAGDVTTGDGLAAALAGADVVIDCLEGQFGESPKAICRRRRDVFLARPSPGGYSQGCGLLSIINCDQSTYSYYVSKADKERISRKGRNWKRLLSEPRNSTAWWK